MFNIKKEKGERVGRVREGKKERIDWKFLIFLLRSISFSIILEIFTIG